MRYSSLVVLALSALVACGDSAPSTCNASIGCGDSSASGTPSDAAVEVDEATPEDLGPSGPDFGLEKSVKTWAVCDGVTDDAVAVAAAFAAAINDAFTLVVDCPLFIHVGSDIARPIFVDDGTTVLFKNGGTLVVDNVLVPSFVVANSTGVTFLDWDVTYDASLPTDFRTMGYYDDGAFVPSTGNAPPSGHFNDKTLTAWLAAHRGLTFDQKDGKIGTVWGGPTNLSSVFYFYGDTSQVTVKGMSLHVPPSAGGERFIPMAFSFLRNYRSNQVVTATTELNSTYMNVPHGLTFSSIRLDGTYMGWQGLMQDATIDNVTSARYGDLQDANGGNVGGVGKWFAPPHLFYINYYYSGDASLFNRNIKITNVLDQGIRVGVARDKGGSDSMSGVADSLKIGGVNVTVDGYTSYRPDGFLQLLDSNGILITHATATYNSAFLNDVYGAILFPTPSYTNATLSHISLTDLAATTGLPPVAGISQTTNVVFSDFNVNVQHWSGSNDTGIVPAITGLSPNNSNDATLSYQLADKGSIVERQHGTVTLTLEAVPAAIEVGGAVTMVWTSRSATACTASGAWTGALSTAGEQRVTLMTAGTQVFDISCTDGVSQASAEMPVVVSP